MNRREFLATGASLAITVTGGCTGCARSPSASLEMDAVTDIEIAKRVTHRLERDEDSPEYQIVSEAVENGSTTVKRTEPRTSKNQTYVYDDAVYELTYEVVKSTPATSFQITLNPVEGEVPQSETVRFKDLPSVDRRKFRERGWVGDDVFLGFGTSLRYLDSEVSESALVPEPKHSVIVWDHDTRGRFTVDGSRETTLKTYRYEAEQVNPSAAEYGARIRREHVFPLTGLSAAERDIVHKAIGQKHGYSVPAGESPPKAFQRLADRFRGREEVERVWEKDDPNSLASGRYIVRYDDDVYWTDILLDEQSPTTGQTG